MNEDLINIVANIHQFNQDLTSLNIKYSEEISQLKSQLQQKENIIKEVKEYIEEHIKYECDDTFNGKQFYSYHLYDFDKKELLKILDKEG